jgi:hypothetical protein
MTKTLVAAPFRADHVGSLLRPDRIHQARKEFQEGALSPRELHDIETQEIKRIVDSSWEYFNRGRAMGEAEVHCRCIKRNLGIRRTEQSWVDRFMTHQR